MCCVFMLSPVAKQLQTSGKKHFNTLKLFLSFAVVLTIAEAVK